MALPLEHRHTHTHKLSLIFHFPTRTFDAQVQENIWYNKPSLFNNVQHWADKNELSLTLEHNEIRSNKIKLRNSDVRERSKREKIHQSKWNISTESTSLMSVCEKEQENASTLKKKKREEKKMELKFGWKKKRRTWMWFVHVWARARESNEIDSIAAEDYNDD